MTPEKQHLTHSQHGQCSVSSFRVCPALTHGAALSACTSAPCPPCPGDSNGPQCDCTPLPRTCPQGTGHGDTRFTGYRHWVLASPDCRDALDLPGGGAGAEGRQQH